MRFYLGTHRPHWLKLPEFREVPLFISHNTLQLKKSPPRAVGAWALDSGGFTQLSKNEDGWPRGCEKPYAEAVARYADEIGNLAWASQQDWMVEPWLLHGRSVLEHQARTIENFLRLTDLEPDLPWLPVIQGWTVDEYHRCVDLFLSAGVDLLQYSAVGVGSVCRRQATDEIEQVVSSLAERGLKIHGFGVKTLGLAKYAKHLVSADSLAWSFGARWEDRLPGCTHKGKCNNCRTLALQWRKKVLASVGG